MFLMIMCSLLPMAFAGQCDLDVAILNQDPFPAVPGEKLEVVFTISNIDSIECGTIEFEVLDEFPFSVAPGFEKSYTIQSGTFTKDYNTQKTIPLDFSVHENALDGDNPVEIRYRTSTAAAGNYVSQTFDIEVEDVKADFEIFVSDYNYLTKEITFEVLNIGKSDIEAVTITIPKQDGVRVHGANKENIGDLSSNEDTSTDFSVDVNANKIMLQISYSDSVNVRRTVEEMVEFDSMLFESTKETTQNNYWNWIIGAVVVILILYIYRRRSKKRK